MGPRRDVVLVTGASTGLGLALARRLIAETGHHVILTARSSSLPRFEAQGITPGERVWIRPLDVIDDAQRRAVVAEADAELGGVDMLVNNAGVAWRAVVEHVSDEERVAQVHVNFRGPMGLMALVLPGMRAKRRGRIVNVSSVGGMMAMPTMAIYSASKWALEGVSEALWYEARPWGVHVTLVQPGFIRSDSFEQTRYTTDAARASQDPDDPYHRHYVEMAAFIARLMRRAPATPDSVAQVVMRVLRARRPPLRSYATLDAFLFAALRRFVPRGLYHEVLYRLLPRVREWGRDEVDHDLRPTVALPLAKPDPVSPPGQ